MKCSKCGGEIKNLPEYLEETETKVVCTKCAGVSEDEGSHVSFDRYRFSHKFFYAGSSGEMDLAA